MYDAMRAAALENREELREGLLFSVASFYVGDET